ncbi:hypothetical protein MNBD_GAMMA11-2821 [hydrothermal vent metagenome]|uniref:Uncharacterized protein n=1 Tax=hydrothermal vent metagenome TaxID=652676 RepID=A0A3B0WQD7_9ZZZZ
MSDEVDEAIYPVANREIGPIEVHKLVVSPAFYFQPWAGYRRC